jgi:hypothetical protein
MLPDIRTVVGLCEHGNEASGFLDNGAPICISNWFWQMGLVSYVAMYMSN